MEKEEKRISQNGLEIYSYKNPASHGFYISLFLRAGSMYETEEENGITHFLEHIAIRNVNALMSGGLYPLLDRYGIEFNASTYSEMVQFYVSGAREHFNIGARIISMLLSPIALTPQDIRTEALRIKAEIRENDENTSLASFTSRIVYEGTALSRPITGSIGNVSRITRSRLEEYRKRTFTKENLFLYVTGAFDDKNLEYLAKTVGCAELGEGEAHNNVAPVPRDFGNRPREVFIKGADFTMLRFTFDIDMSKVKVAECDLLYDILLGGYNSRFFIEMSEERGLFYDLTGATERYKNIGTFTFSYEVRPDAIYDAVEMTLAILSHISLSLIPEEECMKAGYVDNAYMLYDDARELNFTFAYDNHIMSGGYRSLEERAKAYMNVTPERLLAAAKEIFNVKHLTLTVKGNKKKIDTARLADIINKFSEGCEEK